MNIGDIVLRLGVDDPRGFEKEVTKHAGTAGDKAGKTMGQRMQAALNPKTLLAGFAGGIFVSEVTQVISNATNAAAQYADSLSAVGVIFGEDMIPQMEEWGDAASSNFGASKQLALENANIMATLGKSAGLMGQDLVDFSQDMVQLGGDLASFFGGTTEEAIMAVGSALRGESEPIRRYGVLLDDATLRARAFEMGLISTTKNALTPQQKVLAAHAEILAQTTDAQGDFARTSDGMANTQREIAAELENVNIELGEKLMPVMLEFARWAKKTGIPILRELFDLFNFESPESAKGIPILEDIEKFLNDPGRGFGDLFGFNSAEFQKVADALSIPFEEARDRVQRAQDDLGLSVTDAVDHVLAQGERLEGIGESLAQGITRGDPAAVRAAADELAGGVVDAMESAEEEAKEVARRTPGSIANELRAGIDDYDKALEELTVVAENSVSDLAERQKIEAILASQELTDALNSDSTRTRLLAQELVNDLISDYELLAPGALAAGNLVNPAMRDGMESNIGLTIGAAEAIVDAAGNPLVELAPEAYTWGENVLKEFARGMRAGKGILVDAARESASVVRREVAIESEPESPQSPLRGITKWGGNMVRTIADDILANLGVGRAAGMALSSALAPTFGPMASGAAGAAMGGAGDTFVLSVDGVRKVVGSRNDVLDGWDQLRRFG